MSSRSEDLSAFGKAVRAARSKRGMSQESLANDAKVDRAFVSALERGKRNLTLVSLLKVCRTLEVRPSEMFAHWEDETGWEDGGPVS